MVGLTGLTPLRDVHAGLARYARRGTCRSLAALARLRGVQTRASASLRLGSHPISPRERSMRSSSYLQSSIPYPQSKEMVGLTGFEPATSSSRTKRATSLRYSPMNHPDPGTPGRAAKNPISPAFARGISEKFRPGAGSNHKSSINRLARRCPTPENPPEIPTHPHAFASTSLKNSCSAISGFASGCGSKPTP